jgi:hypothetical protein
MKIPNAAKPYDVALTNSARARLVFRDTA